MKNIKILKYLFMYTVLHTEYNSKLSRKEWSFEAKD